MSDGCHEISSWRYSGWCRKASPISSAIPGSQQAKIRIDRDSDLTLEISDRGRGVSGNVQKGKEESRFEVGVGIPSMQERVKLIGGRLDIDSSSHGTTCA